MYYSSMTLMQFSIFTIESCIVLFSRDVGGQQQLPLQVSIESAVSNSLTLNNFVANEDRIIIEGTLSLSGKDPLKWPVYLPVQSTRDNSSFQVFCTIDAVNKGCRDLRTTDCYCKSNTSNTYDIVVNQTLPESLNGAYLRVSWTDEDQKSPEEFYTSKLNVYPPAMGMVSITARDRKVDDCKDLPTENCELKVTANVKYSVKFSVNGLEDPTFMIESDESTESFTNGNDFIVFQKTFTGADRIIQTNFSFAEDKGCRRKDSYSVFFTVVSGLTDLCSWIILLITLVAGLAGACMIAIFLQGDKCGWFSWLKDKSEGADVSEADKEMKCGPSSPLNSEEIEFDDTDVKSGTRAKPVM